MKERLVVSTVLALSLCVFAPGAAAAIIANSAGSLPATAQDLTGVLPSEITGTLDFPNGVNVFKLNILNALDFSAITVLPAAHGVPDPELFLFNAAGVGVYMNDDITFSNTQACLPSGDATNPCVSVRGGVGPLTSGIYYLAITRAGNLPIGVNGELFMPALSTSVAGPVRTDPVTGWDNAINTSPNFDQVNYDILLTGTVPEPATWLLMAGAGLVLGLRRRRLIAR